MDLVPYYCSYHQNINCRLQLSLIRFDSVANTVICISQTKYGYMYCQQVTDHVNHICNNNKKQYMIIYYFRSWDEITGSIEVLWRLTNISKTGIIKILGYRTIFYLRATLKTCNFKHVATLNETRIFLSICMHPCMCTSCMCVYHMHAYSYVCICASYVYVHRKWTKSEERLVYRLVRRWVVRNK